MNEGSVTHRIAAGDGLRLFVRDHAPGADGPVLLCLPGLTRNGKDFADFAARYAGPRRVVTIDYRGRGESAWDPDWRDYTGPVYVDDIGHVLIALGIHRVVAVGTSLGGLLAMGMAVARPACLAGAVLNDIGPEFTAGSIAHILDYVENPPVHDDWDAAARALQRTFPDLPAEKPEEWLRLARNTYRPDADGRLIADWDPAIAKPARHARSLPNHWPLFGAMRKLPVLALRGAQSRVLTAYTLSRMQQVKPDLVAVTVPEVGHPPSMNEPEAVAALDGFLARVAPLGAA